MSADNEHAYVEDLGSSNGTSLNGVRVNGKTLLNNGDRIHVDSSVYVEFQSLASNT